MWGFFSGVIQEWIVAEPDLLGNWSKIQDMKIAAKYW